MSRINLMFDQCIEMGWTVQSEEFTVDNGWIAGAFLLGLAIGGGITAVLIPICFRDWEKKKYFCMGKRQDEEETMLMAIERENTMTAESEEKRPQPPAPVGPKQKDGMGKKARLASLFSRKNKKTTVIEEKPSKGWVEPAGDDKKPTPNLTDTGMVTVLIKQNSGEADAELTRQDMNDVRRMDEDQKEAKDDMLLKMLKMKLRKMKSKGNMNDPLLADLTQKIIDNRKSNSDLLDQEKQEAEQDLKRKHGKNAAALENDLENLQLQMDAKKRQFEKDEMDMIRNELLRISGLSEAEVDDLMNKLKQELAEFERKQGIEQARQAQHLAERLERRRQLLELKRLQDRQKTEKLADEVEAFEDPINKFVQDGKLTDKQKKELLDQHEKNMINLKKQQDIDAMRMQADLAEKLQQRRNARLQKLQEKHERERTNYQARADKASNTKEFLNNYHTLLQQQQNETVETQTELDQTEIHELEKLNKSIEAQTDEVIQQARERMVDAITQAGSLGDGDVKRIMKLHKLRMDSFENRRREERERMRAVLQEKWQQKMQRLEEERQRDEAQRVTVMEKQDETIKQVLNSNLELTEDAKEKILQEHERNMQSLNEQMARSKLKQKMALEHKLSQRRARLSELQAQTELAQVQKRQMTEKEIQKLQDQLEQETALYEKEKREAEEALRKRLTLETQMALDQQEKQVAALLGRLEVGHARRQAMLSKQDKTLKELQDRFSRELEKKEKLESRVDEGGLSSNWADQIIQQHYNQVEHVNETMQQSRERQERIINERIQAKKFQMQRELDDKMKQEMMEIRMARRQAGTGVASNILNAALMSQRQKKAQEELEREMQIELERHREQLNEELQRSLEKELDQHKSQFLNQLAAASNMSPGEMKEIAQSAVQSTGGDKESARRLSRSLQKDMERAKSSLGMLEEDSDEEPTTHYSRQASADDMYRNKTNKDVGRKKKKKHFIPKAKPAFQATTGEQIHGVWDMDHDDDDLL